MEMAEDEVAGQGRQVRLYRNNNDADNQNFTIFGYGSATMFIGIIYLNLADNTLKLQRDTNDAKEDVIMSYYSAFGIWRVLRSTSNVEFALLNLMSGRKSSLDNYRDYIWIIYDPQFIGPVWPWS